MLHVFCMSLIKIIGRNFALADLFDLSPKNKKNNKNNKVRRKITLQVNKMAIKKERGGATMGKGGVKGKKWAI